MNSRFVKSIRFRLTAWYTLLLAATFACGAWGVGFALHTSSRNTIDRELRARLATVRIYIDQQAPTSNVEHLLEELNEQAVMTPAATNLRIADFDGHWFYRSPGTEQWSLGAPNRMRLSEEGDTRTIASGSRKLRVLSARVKIGSVQIGIPLDEFDRLQTDFLWTVLVGAPLLLLLAAWGGFWLSGRALRPVNEIAETARRITEKNLSERLPGTGMDDEIDRLSMILNGMLDRLESAFHRIVEFTADASHELRTPIAIIRTTAELIQSRPRTVDEQARAWNVVLTQADKTTEMLDDLLLLARSDAGSEEIGFEQVSLPRLLEEARDQAVVLAEAKRLDLLMASKVEGYTTGDAEALRRALMIFLDNAIKFTQPPGEILLSLEASDDGSGSLIRIQDTGVGISREDLPRIFDRFYRANKDRSRSTGGAGLGLSIALSIIGRHGGTVSVHSELGEGSRFCIYLPRRGPEHQAAS